MLRTLATALTLALAATACSDRGSQALADSELARDLALVSQTPVYPQFQDSALSTASEPRRAEPPPAQTRTTRPAAPARRTTPVVVQRPQPIASAPVDEPAPAPAPAPARRAGFDAGTAFGITTRSPVCTTNLPGDKIVATLDQGVSGANGAYLPPGTTVVLEVASVTPGDTPDAAQITLRVRSIVINDAAIDVPANVAILSDLERREIPREGGSDKKKVVGGAIAGAILGQIMGRDTKSTVIGAAAGAATGAAVAAAGRKYDACLPAGGSVRVTTSQQITLSD